jgi:outer membrane protein TolC
LDVQQALANFSASQEALAAAELAVTQAEEVYRIQAVRFKTGAILSSELLMSQNARDAAQARLVSAQTDLVAWNLKTQKALGLEQPQL